MTVTMRYSPWRVTMTTDDIVENEGWLTRNAGNVLQGGVVSDGSDDEVCRVGGDDN